MAKGIRRFAAKRGWEQDGEVEKFQHLRITDGAFPVETAKQLGRYLADTYKVKDTDLRRVLRFAAFCVLEKISYTRKDGQYLRWDHRSGRCLGKKVFDKGRIWEFTEAVTGKLAEIAQDISGGGELFACPAGKGKITLKVGSCLDIMPTLDAHSFAGLITSPPYCNRYDYTRTYALELAMFGTGEDALKALRQEMLSCTVENREKESLPQKSNTHLFEKAKTAFESQELLTLILKYLDWCRESGTINNNGIPRMVLNYFRELTLVIFECARVLKRGAPMIMVNDNVRYQGAIIPVDLILSDIAQSAGFDVEAIWVLPVGKGNSSQQMGKHGREEIRKCVYVWRAK